MSFSLIRSTFGKLTNQSLPRAVLGHLAPALLSINQDRARRRRQGFSKKNLFVSLEKLHKQKLMREDRELLELVVLMAEGELI